MLMDRLLTLTEVAEAENVSRVTVWRRIRAGILPAPIMVGARSPRIPESEYRAYRESLPRVSYAPTDDQPEASAA